SFDYYFATRYLHSFPTRRSSDLSISSIHFDTQDENFDWDANWGDEENVIGKKVKVHLADLDRRQWKEDLEEDLAIINQLMDKVNLIKPELDLKLQTLIQSIDRKS